MDEIYALSIHQEGQVFNSVLSLPHIPRPEMTHLIWGFSKVWLNFSKLISVLVSCSDPVVLILKIMMIRLVSKNNKKP